MTRALLLSLLLTLLSPAQGQDDPKTHPPEQRRLVKILLATKRKLVKTYPHLEKPLLHATADYYGELATKTKQGALPTPADFKQTMASWQARLRSVVLGDTPEKRKVVQGYLVRSAAKIDAEVARWQRLGESKGHEVDAVRTREQIERRHTCVAETSLLAGSQIAGLLTMKPELDEQKVRGAFKQALQAIVSSRFAPAPPWTNPDFRYEPAEISPLLWGAAVAALGAGDEESSMEAKWLSMQRAEIEAEVRGWVDQAKALDKTISEPAIRESVETRYRGQAQLLQIAGSAAAKDTVSRRYPGVDGEQLVQAYNRAAFEVMRVLLPPASPWEQPTYVVDEERAVRAIRAKAAAILGK